MFALTKKQHDGQHITFKIMGMHCTSCAMNIDGELEDTPGVIEAETNFAKSITQVTYDPQLVEPATLQKVIESLDYAVEKFV